MYGRQTGDKCLKSVAEILKKGLYRPVDYAARYEEGKFVIALPETNQEGALIVAERMRATIEDLRLPHAGSKMSEFVTISVGVASSVKHDPSLSLDALIALADKALHDAKTGGRNYVSSLMFPQESDQS